MYSEVDAVRANAGFTNRDENGDYLITDATITAKILEADSLINSKIFAVYTVPLVGANLMIRNISEHLVKGFLYMQEYGEETQNLDKGWKELMEFYMNWLDDIADGKQKLLNEDTGLEMPRSSTNLPAFYPNDTSEVDPVNPTNSEITMNKVW